MDRTALKDPSAYNNVDVCDLNDVLGGTPMATFMVNAEGRVTHWNRACEMLTGVRSDDIIGTFKHREAFYTESRQVLADLIASHADPAQLITHYGGKCRPSPSIRGGYEGEDFFPKLGRHGKWLFFTAAPLKSSEGTLLGAIETIQDTTSNHAAEEAIHSSETQYRHLFESANDAILVIEAGRIVDCNRMALDLFKSSGTTLLGRSILDLSPQCQPDGVTSKDHIKNRRDLYNKKMLQCFEWRFLKMDGTWFDAEVSLSQIDVLETPQLLAIVRDVTERNKIVLTLMQREKELEEKSRYLEKVNQALKASLDHREVEKRAVEVNMLVHLKRYVMPYIEELDKCQISADARAYMRIIETNLNDIVSQFSTSKSSKYLDFTPTEVRIADFIRSGRNTKEIAGLLGMSPSSVQWHRKNIRDKLGLVNKKKNLHTYLSSLNE
ncbi:PAS domain S-box protein [Desulfatitalea tepidiphila]|uniref:PAS domain S-box protein n=1 Tax=Desulfatitalea tepidiphila TaxID=1185843 RepID=UPI0006B56421|nr:PAS domain S-box protein [Desulfatitalea tepidiphila]